MDDVISKSSLLQQLKFLQEGVGTPFNDLTAGMNIAYKNVKELIDKLPLDEPERIEETTHLLENVLKENKRLGRLLEEKHEEWLELTDEINNRETEVLSQKWIEDNEYRVIEYPESVVPSKKLQNLIVPKQELPVIPKEVGERIEREIDQFSLYRSLHYAYNYEGFGEDERRIDEWVIENTEEYAQAWLNGFTVLKHPILLAKVKGWEQYVDFVGVIYWGIDDETDRLTFVDRDQALAVTKKDWEQLGISEKNADFVNQYE